MRIIRMLKTPTHVIALTEVTRLGEVGYEGPRWGTQALLVGTSGRLLARQGDDLGDRPRGTLHDLQAPFVTRAQSGDDHEVVAASGVPLRYFCFWPRDEAFLARLNPTLIPPNAARALSAGEPWEVSEPRVVPVPVVDLHTLERDESAGEEVRFADTEAFRELFGEGR